LIPTGERSSLLTHIAGDGKRFIVRADEKLIALTLPQIALIGYSLMTCSG
jgi:hypothetical protein